MTRNLIENVEEWKGIAADSEVRACLRRVAMTILTDINPDTVDLYRRQMEAQRGLIFRYKSRIEAIDTEIGCLDVLVSRLPLEGEGGSFRGMMVQRKAALMIEREETARKAEKVPAEVASSERLLGEIEFQMATANFLMQIVENEEDAEGGVHRLSDEPRSPGDHGAASDPVCDV